MRFYKITSMIETAKMLFSLSNKQFISLENKSFIIGTLLLRHPKFDRKLIVFIKELLVKIFNSTSDSSNSSSKYNKFVGILYTNIMTFLDEAELYDLLELRRDINIYSNELSINKYSLNKKIKVIDEDLFKFSKINEMVKRYLYLYLCIINYFFNYIGFNKMINILKKVLLCSSKENGINNLNAILEKLRKIYLKGLGFDSLCLLIRLVNFLLMMRKILKGIYVMK